MADDKDNLRVDQKWIERLKVFSQMFGEVLDNTEVERIFSDSDFKDYSLFKKYNSIEQFGDYLVKTDCNLVHFTEEQLRCGYNDRIVNKGSLVGWDKFLFDSGVTRAGDMYFKSVPKWSIIKLLDLLDNLPLDKIEITKDIVSFLDFIRLVGDEPLGVIFTGIAIRSGFWDCMVDNFYRNGPVGLTIKTNRELLDRSLLMYRVILDRARVPGDSLVNHPVNKE